MFLGPSLPIDLARAILPDAVYLPPAGQADIMSALRRWEPDIIALIDGTFLHTLAVWHKEILAALDRGVAVYGASSMGALRAVECAPFGMVGIGRIYELFADGTLTDDDEVALAHAGPDEGWRPLSEAMANVRATLAAAAADGVITADEHQRIVAAGKALYFPDRAWPAILAAAVDAGLEPEAAARVRAFVAAHAVDQKRADARELLHTLAALGDDVPPTRTQGWTFHRSRPCKGLEWREVRVQRPAGAVSFETIARHVMLHRSGAAQLMARASAREIQIMFAELLGIDATEQQTAYETARFRRRLGLRTDADLAAYLHRSDVTSWEFDALMHRLAVCRRVEDWLRVRRYRLGLSAPLLDELRMTDEYAQWADRAARQELYAGESGLQAGGGGDLPELLDTLVADQIENTDWRPDCELSTWADEADFGDVYQLHAALSRARAVRRQLEELANGSELRTILASITA